MRRSKSGHQKTKKYATEKRKEVKNMRKESVTITDDAGLHARPASELSKMAAGFKCNVNLSVGDRKVNAKSILAVMALGVKKGTEVVIECDGEDEEKAIGELVGIIGNTLENTEEKASEEKTDEERG